MTIQPQPDRAACHDVRQAAVEAAGRGWAVFPLGPNSKTPRAGLSWPAVACSDPARVAAAGWRPGENFGVAAKLSGIVILDLDMPKPGRVLPPEWQAEPGVIDGKDVLATLCERAGQRWPSTFTVATPSAGWHLYFAALPGRGIGNRPLGPMIDVRGGGDSNGGYVVGPGSVIDGQVYEVIDGRDPEPLPGWIADQLDPPRQPGNPLPPARSVAGEAAAEPYTRLHGILQFVLEGQPGDRNGRLFWAAGRAADMVRQGQVSEDTAERLLVAAALTAGLRGGESEARRTVRSGLHRSAA